MGLHKYQSNNLKGRPPGKPNKITTELRTRIKAFLDENFEMVKKDWRKLEPKERILLYEKMLSFALPRMKETDLNVSIEKMSESQLDEIINRLIKKPDEKGS